MTASLLISSPHRHGGNSVSKIMLSVCLALLPALLCYMALFGWGILMQCVLAVGFALACEYAVLKLRGRKARVFLKDGSAIVTGLLLAFSISPLTPWWITLAGVFFAIVLVKHLYGGLGHNLFNPAMAGYVFILLCFPVQMTTWPAAPGTLEQSISMGTYLARIFSTGAVDMDAISGATPLGQMKSQLAGMSMVSEIMEHPVYGHIGGAGWEWVGLASLLGGAGLLALGIVKWQIPLAMLGSLFGISLLFHLIDPDIYASPLSHVCSGGAIFCAFFIASDPVTSASTPRGRLIYAALIGVLAYIIRTWGAYPEGLAFAVLIANSTVPLIDRMSRPPVLGEASQ